MIIKIGHSKDVHRLQTGESLYLGGVKIEHHKGLVGHSDADVLLHAITEALIGALGLGDIGTLFPDDDPQYKGIDSKCLLREVIEIMNTKGYNISNIDSTIYAERPKLSSYKQKMEKTISEICHIDCHLVNVKATRGEKLGFIGREEGMGAEAVVLLIKE